MVAEPVRTTDNSGVLIGDGSHFGRLIVRIVAGFSLVGMVTVAMRTIGTSRVIGRRILAFPKMEKYQIALVASGQIYDVVIGGGL